MDAGEPTCGADFNRYAETYEAHAFVQRRAAAWLGEWVDCSPAHAVAWEIGAGTGFFTRELLKKGYRVLATDIAPEMVARGRRNCPDAEWMIHNGWWLPRGVADRLCSSSLLQWMPEPEKTLRVFRSALRERGKMLHGFFIAPSLRELYSLADADVFPLQWRTKEEWLLLFEGAGLRVLRAQEQTLRERYADVRALLRTLRNMGTLSRERPPLSLRATRKIMREYAENFADGKGGVFSTWSFLRVEAEPS